MHAHARGTCLIRRTSIHQHTTAFGDPNRRAAVVANRTCVAACVPEQCRYLFYKQTGQHETVLGHEEILVAAHHVESAKKRQKGISARQRKLVQAAENLGRVEKALLPECRFGQGTALQLCEGGSCSSDHAPIF